MAAPTKSYKPIVAIPPGHLPAPPPSGVIHRSLSLPLLAVMHHPLGISTTVVSAMTCWWLGYAEISVIDPLIFKSIFIIFGFTMGFRNVRANQRYFEAMQHASSFFMNVWGIYTPMPLAARLRIRDELLASMKELAAHIHRVGAQRRFCWYGIVGLEPTSEEVEAEAAEFGMHGAGYGSVEAPNPNLPKFASWEEVDHMPTHGRWSLRSADSGMRTSASSGALTSGKWAPGYTFAVISPIPRFLAALNATEAELEQIERGGSEQKLRRGFWHHKPEVLEHFDILLSLAFPSVPDRFMWFVDMCLFIFAVSLPWGITATNLQLTYYGKLSVSSGIVLVINTTLVVIVLFTLNALTLQNEDPLSGDGDDLDLNRLTDTFALAIMTHDKYEAQRASEGGASSSGELQRQMLGIEEESS